MSIEDTNKLLEDLLDYTKQNERWLRFLAWNDLKDTIQDSLNESWEYHAYEMLDGETSSRDMAEELPPHYTTINGRFKQWRTSGIVNQTRSGQYDKLVSLEALNINIPDLETNDGQ